MAAHVFSPSTQEKRQVDLCQIKISCFSSAGATGKLKKTKKRMNYLHLNFQKQTIY